MERTLKIFISCFLGAGIGAAIALQVITALWWIGLLVGGLVGYLSYEFKTVLKAIQQTWHKMIIWRPSEDFWEECRLIGLAILNFITIFLTTFLPLLALYYLTYPEGAFVVSLITLFVAIGFIFIILQLCFNSLYGSLNISETDLLKFGNPIVFWFYVAPKYVIKGVIIGIPFICMFIKRVFILIHSEIRLLCGVDAAIGATIGYLAGNVLIGAIAGGIIGIFNYKIISVRILHLAPTKNT